MVDDDGTSELLLLCISWASAGVEAHVVVLLIAQLKLPALPVFLVCEMPADGIGPGCLVKPKLNQVLDHLCTSAEIAMNFCLSGSAACRLQRLEYRFEALDALRVQDLTDLTDVVLGIRRRKPTTQDDAVLKRLAQMSKPPQAQSARHPATGATRRRGGRHAGRGRGAARGAGRGAGGDDEDLAASAAIDAHVESDRSGTSTSEASNLGDSQSDSENEVLGLIAGEAIAPHEVEGHELELDRETLHLWEEGGEHARDPDEPDEVLEFDEDGATVLDFDAARTKLGRVKGLHEGTSREQLSVYCRRHKCSKILRAVDSPTHVQLLQWFEAGKKIPAGKEHRATHMRLFQGRPLEGGKCSPYFVFKISFVLFARLILHPILISFQLCYDIEYFIVFQLVCPMYCVFMLYKKEN